MTTFFRSALGLLSPARVWRRRRSSLTRCASSIVRLSCAALYTGFGMCRLLSIKMACFSQSAQGGARRGMTEWSKNGGSPLHFADLGIHLPPLLERGPVLDRRALARRDDAEFL